GAEPRGGGLGANGLAFDATGRLLLCEHGNRRIGCFETDGTRAVLADRFEGRRFHSPNDLVVHSSGDVYFTDPPYGLPKGPADTETREIAWHGVYRLSPDGRVTLATREMTFPNGITLSPDEKTLYVAQSDPQAAIWKAFPVRADGTLGASRVVADATSMVAGHRGLPDGMKTDTTGHLWATGPGGVHVMTPAGKLLARLDTRMACGNCCFGGEDGSWLYICSDAFLVRVKTRVKGKGW
ncbi:MAG: SMP-30/gluconolactonase/LRE family protein, partial [Verrucomicrobiota bacterium]